MASGSNKRSLHILLTLAALMMVIVSPAAAFTINVPEPSSYVELGLAGAGLAGWAIWRFSSRRRT
jgi:hypothetical protein